MSAPSNKETPVERMERLAGVLRSLYALCATWRKWVFWGMLFGFADIALVVAYHYPPGDILLRIRLVSPVVLTFLLLSGGMYMVKRTLGDKFAPG
ncbi:TPA: hypothetical protein DHW58_02100 [Patescibacteria group bacterium]|uniref:Uncharacterized protein n=2 Tax=Bacteria division Kazan-3B-28 TaxID=1798534 RepID=A0A0G1X706_UNCK3|nr:MAG: hypothetical protein VE99_C0001G0087 [candidate division Kazan bacterium GW2011_GWC1_52_13]KKW26756.1 MAG: hypothetical protein VF00_C0002G0081 [candidate division Kazan bacterium GW2011_GWB1_52_7]HCL47762.1 hypothetical protein [Patescibacteria group bacterium]